MSATFALLLQTLQHKPIVIQEVYSWLSKLTSILYCFIIKTPRRKRALATAEVLFHFMHQLSLCA